MIRSKVVLFALLLCASCGEALVEKPANLIAPGKMSDVLYDIAVMEAIDNSYRGALERNGIEIMSFIYEKHGVDSLQFASSDLYYASHPAIYQEIYQRVEDRLIRERDSVGEVIRKGNEAGREKVVREKPGDSI